jgi:hypothetical protein
MMPAAAGLPRIDHWQALLVAPAGAGLPHSTSATTSGWGRWRGEPRTSKGDCRPGER